MSRCFEKDERHVDAIKVKIEKLNFFCFFVFRVCSCSCIVLIIFIFYFYLCSLGVYVCVH